VTLKAIIRGFAFEDKEGFQKLLIWVEDALQRIILEILKVKTPNL
jgi:hypothetical protein